MLAAALILLARPTHAATIYSGLEDLAIPTSFAGLYLDIDTGATGASAFAGWDVNPFFGGAGVGNSAAFQPVRVGTSNLDAVLNLAPGTVVNNTFLYASGVGGSGNPGHEHLGPASNQFQPGSEGYLGFRFTTNASAGPYYGWMRVVFTANTGGALVKDWAYETGGGSLRTGHILQSAPMSGVQTTTLGGGGSDNYTLGHALTDGAHTTAVVKSSASEWNLDGAHTYTGATTIQAGTLDLGATGRLTGTSMVTINSGGTLLLGGAGGLDQVSDSAFFTLAGGTLKRGGLAGLHENLGVLTLSASSIIDFGTGGAGQTLTFADSDLADWSGTLSIWNWTAGTDRLFFGSSALGLTTSQLASIRFYSDAGGTELGAGFSPAITTLGEVVPVPEPSATLLSVGLLGWCAARERRATRRGRRAGGLRWGGTPGLRRVGAVRLMMLRRIRGRSDHEHGTHSRSGGGSRFPHGVADADRDSVAAVSVWDRGAGAHELVGDFRSCARGDSGASGV